MKRIVILFSIVFSVVGSIYAQTQTEPIAIVRKGGSEHYYLNGEQKNIKELRNIMMCDPIAYVNIYSARDFEVAAKIIGITGLSLAGVSVLFRFTHHLYLPDPSKTMETVVISAFASGLVLVAEGVMFGAISNSKTKRAVSIYNSRINQTSFWDTHELRLGFTGNGIGVTFCF